MLCMVYTVTGVCVCVLLFVHWLIDLFIYCRTIVTLQGYKLRRTLYIPTLHKSKRNCYKCRYFRMPVSSFSSPFDLFN